MGEWIEHDGQRPELRHGLQIEIEFSGEFGQKSPMDCPAIGSDYPGFYWSWRKVSAGWFRTRKIRICDDPDYMPIKRYRIIDDDKQVEWLRRIADKPEDIVIIDPQAPWVFPKEKETTE